MVCDMTYFGQPLTFLFPMLHFWVAVVPTYLSMLLQKWIIMLMPVAAGQMACRRAAGRMAGWSGAVQTSVLNRTVLNLRQDFISTSLSELCFCVGQCSFVDLYVLK